MSTEAVFELVSTSASLLGKVGQLILSSAENRAAVIASMRDDVAKMGTMLSPGGLVEQEWAKHDAKLDAAIEKAKRDAQQPR